MYIGVYLCLGGIFILLSILLIPIVRMKLNKFITLSIIALIACLVVFESASTIFNIQIPGSYNFPGDYLGSGPIGWFIMFLPLLGITSPLIISYYLRVRHSSSEGQT
jgi:hypothetical protein